MTTRYLCPFIALLVVAATFGTAADADAQWRTVAYSSSNFTAAGSMTWTVEESDQLTYSYMVNDRTMTLALVLQNTSFSGTLANELRVKIPAGYVGGRTIANPAFIRRDSGSPFMETGLAFTTSGRDYITIYRPDFSNMQSSTNLTYIYLTMTFDVQ